MYMLRAPERVHLETQRVLPHVRWVLGQAGLVLAGILVSEWNSTAIDRTVNIQSG